MTREEQIEKAAKRYVKDIVTPIPASLMTAFVKGAEWADEHPQNKPKWSEEDEAHLHSVTTHLGQWIERHPNTCGADIQWENLAWLKQIKQRMGGNKQ